jgi:methyl-accepting chemotaxis protein
MLSKLSISRLVISIFLVIVASLITLSAKSIIDALGEKRAAEKISFSNKIGKLLIAAAGDWAAERDAIGSVVVSMDAAPSGLLVMAKGRRQSGNKALAEALELLGTDVLNSHQKNLINDTRKILGEVEKLREMADADIIKPMVDRENPSMAMAWHPAVTRLIVASQQLRVGSEFIPGNTNVLLPLFDYLKDAVWEMNEFAGQERAIVGRAIASGSPIRPGQIQQLAAAAGRIESAWRSIKNIAGRQEVEEWAPDISAHIADVESRFFGDYRKVFDSVYRAGTARKRKPYPLTSSQWYTAANEAIDTILGMGTSVGHNTDRLTQEISGTANRTLAVSVVMALIVTAFATAGIMVIQIRALKPIRKMSGVIGNLARQEYDVEVDGQERCDEIGEISRSIVVLRDELLRGKELAAARLREEKAKAKRAEAITMLTSSFESDVSGILNDVMSGSGVMCSNADHMSEVVCETERQSNEMHQASSKVLESVSSVASATEELTSSIDEIGQQVNISSQVANAAVNETEQAKQKVHGLSEAVQKIEAVLDLITNIADQTNLLALNATIEAARAGEAGKGFAVVASEVKSLASQTSKATEEIGSYVSDVQVSSSDAVAAIKGISKIIQEVEEAASNIAAAIEEQGAATREIPQSTEKAAGGTRDLAVNIDGVSSIASQAKQTSSEVNSASESLASRVDNLNDMLAEFLREIRAA